uniref:Bm1451 n=1 Tax=Brugia malayi TaxID=6279 RepID=A0A1I9G442_BRUMA|nr:Bm1451 [Brugia malayi]
MKKRNLIVPLFHFPTSGQSSRADIRELKSAYPLIMQ